MAKRDPVRSVVFVHYHLSGLTSLICMIPAWQKARIYLRLIVLCQKPHRGIIVTPEEAL